jgi:hypothetical protein
MSGLPVETSATFIDRSSWSAGPWDDEPVDRVDWVDPVTRYPCFVKRGPYGAWCGYVGVPPGHPHYGDGTDVDVDVHGCLTYAAPCEPDDGRPHVERICHVPAPDEPDDVWWLGFDCGHGCDLIPGMPWLTVPRETDAIWNPVYRTVDYAKDQATRLARQLTRRHPKEFR